MSFTDLATSLLQGQNELEERKKGFLDKCDQAINHINKLKNVAQSFVQKFYCEPMESKHIFLNPMKQLDELTYLITNFNTCINRLDANQCPINHSNTHTSTNEVDLIKLSNDSISENASQEQNEKLPVFPNFEGTITPSNVAGTTECDTQECSLPSQTLLQIKQEYPALILHVDGRLFWVITESPAYAFDFIYEMSNYYAKCATTLTVEDFTMLTYCVCYSPDDNYFYRGLFIKILEGDNNKAEVYLLDIGAKLITDVENIKPLVPRFCKDPPFARCCYLAGICTIDNNEKELEVFLEKYLGIPCTIQVEDDTSQYLGVYVTLQSTNENLNKMLLDQGLTTAFKNINLEETKSEETQNNCSGQEMTDLQMNINDCPEHDDPVLAVRGYHNRDEVDVCKFYEGGPQRTCFKGAMCKKKHIKLHPDGWTLDRTPVLAKCPVQTLPPPGSRLLVHVTHVAHFNRIFVQMINEVNDLEIPVVVPIGDSMLINNLEALMRDMNSLETQLTSRPLKMIPAPGELVAAMYTVDGLWYRARVLSSSPRDQTVEVMYIDYGNVEFVKEKNVRELEARHCTLAEQAVCCVLAGVRARSSCSRQWAQARTILQQHIENRNLRGSVIAWGYDEITVELYDKNNKSISEIFANSDIIELVEYTQEPTNGITQRVVVP